MYLCIHTGQFLPSVSSSIVGHHHPGLMTPLMMECHNHHGQSQAPHPHSQYSLAGRMYPHHPQPHLYIPPGL